MFGGAEGAAGPQAAPEAAGGSSQVWGGCCCRGGGPQGGLLRTPGFQVSVFQGHYFTFLHCSLHFPHCHEANPLPAPAPGLPVCRE